jgi:hypothetical protein
METDESIQKTIRKQCVLTFFWEELSRRPNSFLNEDVQTALSLPSRIVFRQSWILTKS